MENCQCFMNDPSIKKALSIKNARALKYPVKAVTGNYPFRSFMTSLSRLFTVTSRVYIPFGKSCVSFKV